MNNYVNILILDDDIEYRESTRAVLEGVGHSTIVFSSATDALDRIGRDDIDLMLVDYLMPGMNGEDFIRKAWSTKQWPPALLITGISPWQTAGVLELGVGYLRKPVSPEILIETVELMLKKGEKEWALSH